MVQKDKDEVRQSGAGRFKTFMVAALALLALASHAQDGISKSAVTLGQSAALTGPSATLGVPFTQGAKLYFDRLNSAGGINGRKVELVSMDDAGSPEQAVANTKKLLAQGVLSLFGYVGSPQVTAVNAQLNSADVLLFGAMAGADELRGSLYPNVYSIRPGYSEEAAVITKHAETLGMKRLAIVHAKDAESLAALDSAERTMHGLGANLVIKASFDALDKTIAAKPQSVLLISDPKAAAVTIRDLRAKGYKGPIYGFSNTGESLLAEQLGAAGAGVVLVRVTPRSDNAKSVLVRELLADAAAAKVGKANVYMLEGYIAAWAFTEALRKAGKEPNRAKLRRALDGLQEMNLGGFRIHFDGDRVGSKMVELSLIDGAGRVRE
jgi:ABC-type branched-subunit amino acid transport system substrate-binding protein